MNSQPLATPRVTVPVETEATPEQLRNQLAFLSRQLDTLILYAKYARHRAHVYEVGDVPLKVKQRRRARNKVARQSRRKNR